MVHPIATLLASRRGMLSYAVKTNSSLPTGVKNEAIDPSAEDSVDALERLGPYVAPQYANEFETFLQDSIVELFDETATDCLVSQIDTIFVLASIHPSKLPKKTRGWFFKILHLDQFQTEFLDNKTTVVEFIANIHRIVYTELDPDCWIEQLLRFTLNREKKQTTVSTQNLHVFDSLSVEASQEINRVRKHLGVFDFVSAKEVLLMILFPQANALTRRGCRKPQNFESLDTHIDAYVMDELVCYLLNDDSARESETLGLQDLDFFWTSKIEASMGVKLNFFRIAAVLLHEDYKERWSNLGWFGSRLFENELETYRETHIESLLSPERNLMPLMT